MFFYGRKYTFVPKIEQFMTFDKFLEKATLVDTIAFTIFFCIGQDAIGILTVLVIIPMTGLAVLAIHEGASD